MKRTTISLPDDLAAALEREARRRRVTVSQIAREAIMARLGRSSTGKRELPFFALGRSGDDSTSDKIDEILRAEWTPERLLDRDS
jgi:predicted transcriptional regulator